MNLENSCIVIFGASGDLTFRKLIPALYNLYKIGKLGEHFSVLGVARSELSDDSFRQKMYDALVKFEKASGESLDAFCEHLYYQAVNTSDALDYVKLLPRLDELHDRYGSCGNTLYYLSTPPSLYGVIPECLAAHGLTTEEYGWKRIIVEKPFGYDIKTAKELDVQIHKYFEEHQIYRIDHYLGKETVQNLLVLRFSNGLFEPLWNRNFIDYVEITGAESIGVEERGGYYDGSGAMRDMFQNHLLQVLAMVAMEPPAIINADSMRDEVAKVLYCLHPLSNEDLKNNLVLGQYTASTIDGEEVKGYLEEKGVPADSTTETYMALRCEIDNWRWAGVPFYVRTGKRLPTRVTEVVIHFKTTPHPVFSQNAPDNKLIIRIQPDEGISMRFGLKKPGAGFEAKEVSMDFRYSDLSSAANLMTAYERLLLDAIKGDATLFARTDAVHACWKFVQPILDYKAERGQVYEYEAGTWGPSEADKLIAKHGKVWRKPSGLMKKKVCPHKDFMNYITFPTAQNAVEKIAQEFVLYSQLNRPVHISLSGGSTPKLLFKTLAQEPYKSKIQWQNLHFWWGDDRMVLPQDPESNYGEVQKLLFDHIQIPAENIHRIRGEEPVEQELARFSQELTACVPNGEFDWIILGMGTDGHTASLFPHQTDFNEPNLAVIAKHPETGQIRISKTAKLIEQAKRITYLVTGASKAEILKEIETTPAENLPYPAARIKAKNGVTEWYLDKDAARLL